ncbi:sugar transferase [Pricia sp.]|uniref:sugar transferase n=1 Tax=Pricia sp. TaxID=2268138 RepID=UPI0035940799
MYTSITKPFFDFFASLMAIALFSPLIILIYLVLRMSGIDKQLFYQPRPGKDEKIFNIVKFRTMTDGRDERGELLPDEKRLTGIGSVLRKTSLDELPQLFNVLKGDMSLVGPRPLRIRYLPYYTTRENLRHTVKPGITGLAQVSGRNALSWDKRLELDARYAENLSIMLDCKILLMTIIKIFKTSETEFSEGPDSLDEFRKSETASRSSFTLKE